MNTRVIIVVEQQEIRADRAIAHHFPWASRRRIAMLFAEKSVLREGRAIKKGEMLGDSDVIELTALPASHQDLSPTAEDLQLPTLWVDETLVALNKRAGLASHPLRPHEGGTVANHLVFEYPECAAIGNDPREAGLLHRLDRHTSGVIAACREQDAWQAGRAAFSHGQVSKTYLAVVVGEAIDGINEAPLLQRGQRVIASESGLAASSRWQVLDTNDGHSLVRVTTSTGRMHQVRAHLAQADRPIHGDALYGQALGDRVGFFLHAETLRMPHPATNKEITIHAPLPAGRQDWLRALGLRLD